MTLLARLSREVFAVEYNYGVEALDGLRQLEAGVRHEKIPQPDTVTYEKIGSVAVIALDGAMYKKEMIGACDSVIGYDRIESYIAEANNDNSIKTILFRVDTPGGSVAGADTVREAIISSSKKTILYAENLLASAGLWIFSAVDEIYTHELTAIGSIGVLVAYEDKESKTKFLVSSNAPNKVCSITDPACQGKVKARLNEYEAKFYDRLVSSFGKDKETIKTDFDSGATILGDTAYKLGYIKELLSFDTLLSRLAKDEHLATMPPSNGKIVNQNSEKELAMNKELQAQSDEANATIEGLQSKIGGIEAQLADANAKVVATQEKAVKVIATGMTYGASKEAMLEALQAETTLEAHNKVLTAVAEAKESGETIAGGEKQLEGNKPKTEDEVKSEFDPYKI